MPRIHCPVPLSSGQTLDLPAAAARHVQVLRLQPGDGLTLFNGDGGEWSATITAMGRSSVGVLVGAHNATERELARAVHLWVGLMANDRMDWLVEKATELGVASITPIKAARSVLKLDGERAEKRRAHWQAIAVAACEQCGRNRVPAIAAVQKLAQAIASADSTGQRRVLSLADDALPFTVAADTAPITFLSGPEGGLTADEEVAARAAGFAPTTLGPRTLRAETAPLAALVLSI